MELHELARKMPGRNLRGKVTAPSITTLSCSEIVTFCSHTHPALGMLDLAVENSMEEKGNPLFRSFQIG